LVLALQLFTTPSPFPLQTTNLEHTEACGTFPNWFFEHSGWGEGCGALKVFDPGAKIKSGLKLKFSYLYSI